MRGEIPRYPKEKSPDKKYEVCAYHVLRLTSKSFVVVVALSCPPKSFSREVFLVVLSAFAPGLSLLVFGHVRACVVCLRCHPVCCFRFCEVRWIRRGQYRRFFACT